MKKGRYIVFFYKTNEFTGTLKSSEEGEVYWVEREKLASMPLASGMQDMLRVFLEDDLSEYYIYKDNEQWKYVLK